MFVISCVSLRCVFLFCWFLFYMSFWIGRDGRAVYAHRPYACGADFALLLLTFFSHSGRLSHGRSFSQPFRFVMDERLSKTWHSSVNQWIMEQEGEKEGESKPQEGIIENRDKCDSCTGHVCHVYPLICDGPSPKRCTVNPWPPDRKCPRFRLLFINQPALLTCSGKTSLSSQFFSTLFRICYPIAFQPRPSPPSRHAFRVAGAIYNNRRRAQLVSISICYSHKRII